MSIRQTNHRPSNLISYVWMQLKPYRGWALVFASLAFIAGLWGPFNSMLIKQMINLLPAAQPQQIEILVKPAILIVLNFIVLDNCTWRSMEYINCRYQAVIKNKIIADLFELVLEQPAQFFQDNLSGKIANQITKFADNMEIILHQVSRDFFRGISLVLAAFIASFCVNPIFCLILMLWFVIFIAFSLKMSRHLVKLADQHAENEALVAGQLVDCISNHSNVRIFARKNFELTRLNSFLKILQNSFTRKEKFLVFLYGIQGSLIALMMAGVVYFLVRFYKLNLVSSGDFALILGLSMELAHMIWYTMSRVDDFNQAYGKCKQSFKALMVYPAVQDHPQAPELICREGKIVFEQVSFGYQGSEFLFKNKSILIEAGQKVGLVGYSGGGKSSFVNLIARAQDVSSGKILIDGQDISTVSQKSLRQAITIIPQDPVLFHRSLLDNIRYGNIAASEQEVISAAQQADAHDFIVQLPQAYASLVGERGVKLSGGQRQRIAIARAILKNSPILILDEATSQLDSITENTIQASLWRLMQGKTTIIIAHRLSTLLNMDRILVFDQGRIVQDGRHEELIEQPGLYKTLWDTQIGGFLADKV